MDVFYAERLAKRKAAPISWEIHGALGRVSGAFRDL